MKNHKNYFFIRLIILILVSSTFLYFSISLTKNKITFIENSVQMTGVVISYSKSKSSEGKTMFSPTVEYVDQASTKQQFTSNLSSNNQSYEIGEVVNILIPSDHNIPKINSFMELWFGEMILWFFCLASIVVTVLYVVFSIIGRNIDKQLAEKGVTIQAKVDSVEESAYYKETALTYIIKAQWLNSKDNKVYVFESVDFNYNPKDFVGEFIDVRILPNNPKIYKMDLSKLPEQSA
jgi:hypothetical protein